MKASIITRARNRLEYTIRCIDSVARNTHGIDYEHIIINQACSDGTRQWLDWIAQHGGEWFSRVRAIHSEENVGDWGGMLHGGKQATGEYIIQLDNDAVVPEGWLDVLIEVLDRTTFSTVGLNIIGTERYNVAIVKTDEIKREDESLIEIGKCIYVTCCWICRAEMFHKFAPSRRNCRDTCRAIPGGSCMVLNVTATELDSSATDKRRSQSLSQAKYPRTPQIWEKL